MKRSRRRFALPSEAGRPNVGTPFFARHGREDFEDQITKFRAKVVILLVGERPGPAVGKPPAAAHSPRVANFTNEADRTCISNIHQGRRRSRRRGIVDLAKRMLERESVRHQHDPLAGDIMPIRFDLRTFSDRHARDALP